MAGFSGGSRRENQRESDKPDTSRQNKARQAFKGHGRERQTAQEAGAARQTAAHTPKGALRGEGESAGAPPLCLGLSGLSDFHGGELTPERLSLLADAVRVRKYPEWRAAFELARVLRAFGDCPAPLEQVGVVFFQTLGMDPFAGWATVEAVWGKVECPAEECPWDSAVAAALTNPHLFDPAAGMFSAVATCAWHLSIRAGGGSFTFPVQNVAVSFKFSVPTASRVIANLVSRRVLRCVDESWSYTEGKAKLFTFLAKPIGRMAD